MAWQRCRARVVVLEIEVAAFQDNSEDVQVGVPARGRSSSHLGRLAAMAEPQSRTSFAGLEIEAHDRRLAALAPLEGQRPRRVVGENGPAGLGIAEVDREAATDMAVVGNVNELCDRLAAYLDSRLVGDVD